MKKHLLIRYILIFVCSLSVSESFGQKFISNFWQKYKKYTVVRGEEYQDDLPVYFGFSFDFSSEKYSIEYANDWNKNSFFVNHDKEVTFTEITSVKGTRIGGGIPIRIRLHDNLSIATGVSYYLDINQIFETSDNSNMGLIYKYSDTTVSPGILLQNGFINDTRTNFTSTEFPLHLKYYSDKKYFSQHDTYPFRMYLLGGARLSYFKDLKKMNSEKTNYTAFNKVYDIPLNFKPTQISFESGIGIDKYLHYFKISVELRYSENIGNLLDKQKYQQVKNHFQTTRPDYDNPHMNAINALGLRGWRLSIIFE